MYQDSHHKTLERNWHAECSQQTEERACDTQERISLLPCSGQESLDMGVVH